MARVAPGFPTTGPWSVAPGFPDPSSLSPDRQNQLQQEAKKGALASITYQFQRYEQELNTYQSSYQGLINEMRTNTPRDVHDTISSLELALTTLYKLAIFIRGDYDTREADVDQRTNLLSMAVNAFQSVKARAEAAFNGVATLHSRNVELRSTKIKPLSDKIDTLMKITDIEMQSVNSQIEAYSQQIYDLRESYQQTRDSLNTLRDKLSSARSAREQEKWGWRIGTFGIVEIPGVGIPDLGGLESSASDLETSINQIQVDLDTKQSQLNQTIQNQTDLKLIRFQQGLLKDKLPALESNADHLLDIMDQMQKDLLVLKDVASQLFVKVGDISAKAEVTAELAFTKKEFASGILDVCAAALIDPRVQDEIQMVFDEIVNQYGSPLPDVVQEVADHVRSGLDTVLFQKSLEAAAGGN